MECWSNAVADSSLTDRVHAIPRHRSLARLAFEEFNTTSAEASGVRLGASVGLAS